MNRVSFSQIKFQVFVVFLAFLASVAYAGKELTPEQVPYASTVSVEEAKALFDQGVLFVDPRKDKDWNAGRIPDAEHLPLETGFTEEALGALVGKGEPFVVYCNGIKCKVSMDAAEKAATWGYSQVKWFREGMPGWKAAGYPVE